MDRSANITVLQVAVGKSGRYLEEHSHRMISVLKWCMFRRYSYVLETNDFCLMFRKYAKELGVQKAGSYHWPICHDPEVSGRSTPAGSGRSGRGVRRTACFEPLGDELNLPEPRSDAPLPSHSTSRPRDFATSRPPVRRAEHGACSRSVVIQCSPSHGA